MEPIQEASGATPAGILNPTKNDDFSMSRTDEDHIRHSLSRGSAAITARFYLGPDPRPDFVGNTIVNDRGEIPVIEMIEITNRNDIKNSPAVNIATDHHRYKSRDEGGFPQEYRAFRMGLERESTGYAVREWLGDNDLVKRLGVYEIYTVEQLAAASDSLCQTLGPGTYGLRTRAIAFLKSREGAEGAERVMAENAVLKREMEELKAAVALLTKTSGAAAARAEPEHPEIHPGEQLPPTPERRGPGRPRVNQEN